MVHGVGGGELVVVLTVVVMVQVSRSWWSIEWICVLGLVEFGEIGFEMKVCVCEMLQDGRRGQNGDDFFIIVGYGYCRMDGGRTVCLECYGMVRFG